MRVDFLSVFCRACALLILLLRPLYSCHAADIVWTNLNGGNWSIAANWSPNQVPTVSDNALITNNGTYTVTVNVTATNNSLTLGGSSGQQILTNSANTLTLSNASFVGVNGVFSLGGGTLAGNGPLTVNGLFNWTGGTVGGFTAVNIAVNGLMNISGGVLKTLDGILTNAGAISWTGTGNLQLIYNGTTVNGSIYNLPGAVFNVQNDQTIVGFNGIERINNAGLFRKLGGVGTTTVNVLFTNMDTLDVESGTVSFNTGGLSSGTFTNVAGTTIAITSGNYTFTAGSQLTGAGTNVWSGGNVTVNTTVTTSNVLLTGSATLLGTNSLTGAVTWSGGAIGNLANVTIPASTVLNINGGTLKTLDGILTNAGTINWTGTGNLQLVYNGTTVNGSIYNLLGAVFNVQNDQTIVGFNGIEPINNAGLFRKLGGINTTAINVLFTNSGTFDVESGTVNLGDGGASSGTFTNVAGTTIANTAGNYTFAAGSQVTGAGTNVWSGGNVTVNTTVTTSNVLLTGSATLLGTNSLTGAVTWSGGTIGGFANVTIPASTVLNISGGVLKTLDGILTNAGTINWTGTGNLQLVYNGTTVNGSIYNLPGAVFNVQNDQTIVAFTGLEPIINAGLFRKLGGAGTTAVGIDFTNSGTLDVESGTVSFNGNGASSGTFTAAAGATIANTGGTFTFAASSQLTGAGTNVWSGGTITANIPVTILNVLLTGSATLMGTNSFTGAVTWNGGTIGGLANVTIPASTVLNINGSVLKTLDGILTNAGTINWTGTGNLQLVYNGTTVDGSIYNLPGAVFNVQNDQTIVAFTGLEPIINAGLFRKLGGIGTTAVGIDFTNSGTLDVESGTMSFNGNGASSGTFTNVAGATIANTGGTYSFVAGSQLTGAGTNVWSGGTVTANIPVTTLNVLLTGSATLMGTNSFTGVVTWSGGTIGNLANVTIPASAMMNISGSALKTLDGILTNAGTINWTGTGNLQLVYNGTTVDGSIYNLPGAVFNVQNDQSIVAFTGTERINNAGLFRKLAGTNTPIGVNFTNTGTLDSQSGILNLTSGHSLTGGTLNFGINSLTNFGKINLSGAAALTGAVSANLNNGYIPITNNSFGVLTYGSLTGIFTNAFLPAADAWGTNYAATVFTLVVSNARPILSTNLTQIVDELTTLTVTNIATDLDLPPQTITFSLSGPTNGMSIDSSSGVFTWTPAQTNSPSTNTVNVVATDNGTPPLSATNSFLAVVREVNVAPVLSNISTQSVNALVLLTVTNTATESNIHSTLGYALISPPAGASIDTNGIITWTPSRPQGPSTNTITTLVTNTNIFDLINPHLSVTNVFTVIVFAPTLAPLNNQTVNAGQTVSFAASATDNDSTRILTFSLLSAPPTAAINPASGQFTWRPPVASAGSSNNVQVQVTDNSVPPLTDAKSFAIFVNTLTAVTLTPTAYTNGQLTIQVSGPAGPDYILQSATTLGSNSIWGNLSTNTPATLPFSITDTNANGFTNRFYREKLGP